MGLIGSVTLTPEKPKTGESVCLEVVSPDGKTYVDRADYVVIISGVPGAKQFMQFDRAGKHLILIVVHSKSGGYDYRRLYLDVAQNTEVLPIIKIHQQLDKPLHVDLTLSWGRALKPNRIKQAVSKRETLQPAQTVKPVISFRSVTAPRFLFDFGNGKKYRSWTPKAGCDFTDDLDPDKETQCFHISVFITDPENSKTITISRTICIVNPYFMAKKHGFIQPLIRSDHKAVTVVPEKPFAHRSGNRAPVYILANLSVKNMEKEMIILNKCIVEPILDDTGVATEHYTLQTGAIRLHPAMWTQISEKVFIQSLPKNAIGFGLHYTGQTSDGKPIRVSSYFDIPEKMKHHNIFVTKEKEPLKIKRDPKYPSRPSGDNLPTIKMPPTEGELCDPYNMPDEIPDGLVCQPTVETVDTQIPGRFLNARKGDIILSPGSSSGFVAKILRSLQPPQYHSHSGIMTKNHTQLTHSTASEDWLTDDDHDRIGVDGFDPECLRYLWPGVITQSVENTVNGENLTYPDDDEPKGVYNISGFYPYHRDIGSLIVQPLVVKPDPSSESKMVRDKLIKIATYALAQTNKSHYRFYSYTKPDIALTSEGNAPDSAGWASGTYPTVCSSFVWKCVTDMCHPFKMEGNELEENDKAEGAEITQGCADGLYLFRAHERLLAGETIYAEIYGNVMYALNHASVLEEFFAKLDDMPDDCANQVTNAFASDWTETESKDSEAWKNVADSNSISPDNILWWDKSLGLYGYSEILLYSAPHKERVHIYKWRSVTGFGTLKGRVLYNSTLVENAMVEIPHYPDLCARTDQNGEFTIHDVPEGLCEVTALKINDSDLPWKTPAPVLVHIARDEEHYEVITLKGPDPANRLVSLGVTVVVKSLPGWGSAEGCPSNSNIEEVFVAVRPGQTSPESVVSAVVADARGEARVTVTGHADHSVTVTMRARVYNSYDVSDDWEESENCSFNVGENQIDEKWVHIKWKNEVWIYVNAYNQVDPAG
jgi:hypothetical protein